MDSSDPSSSVDSTDTPYRYAAYANRVRTILLSAHRYVAYTSDIGESFRPVAHPWLVRSAYGISWAYLLGDVSHEGYKAYLRNRRALVPPGETYKDASELPQDQVIRGMATGNIAGPLKGLNGKESTENDTLTPWPTMEISLAEDYRMVMAKRAVFQGIASMGLPAFTIHSVVKYSGRMVRGAKSTFMRTWFPIGVCFSLALSECAYANLDSSSVSQSSHPCHTSSTTPSKKQSTGPSALPCASTAARTPSVHCPTTPTTRAPATTMATVSQPLSSPGKNTRASVKRRASSDGSRRVVRLCRAGWGACLALVRRRKNRKERGSWLVHDRENPPSLFLLFFCGLISLLSFLVHIYIPSSFIDIPSLWWVCLSTLNTRFQSSYQPDGV